MKKSYLKRKGKSRFPARRCPEYMDWLYKKLWEGDCYEWCDACGTMLAVDRAHLKAKGSGGDDLNNVVLLCRYCHQYSEKRADAFIAECGVDLWAKAREHTAAWERTREAA